MEEATRVVLVEFPKVFGIDLSITNEVVLLWLGAIVTFLLAVAACRGREAATRGRFRNLFEMLVEMVEKEVIGGNANKATRALTPFLLTMFFFILVCNLLGMVPIPGVFKAVTSNINVTAGLAIAVFALTVVAEVSHHGVLGFLGRFMPAGIPRWAGVFLVPIEIASWLVRPLSLAVRLFANMVVGHVLLFVLIGMAVASGWWIVGVLPAAAAVVMSCFELFVCFIQALVFTLLAGLYLKEAVEGHQATH